MKLLNDKSLQLELSKQN